MPNSLSYLSPIFVSDSSRSITQSRGLSVCTHHGGEKYGCESRTSWDQVSALDNLRSTGASLDALAVLPVVHSNRSRDVHKLLHRAIRTVLVSSSGIHLATRMALLWQSDTADRQGLQARRIQDTISDGDYIVRYRMAVLQLHTVDHRNNHYHANVSLLRPRISHALRSIACTVCRAGTLGCSAPRVRFVGSRVIKPSIPFFFRGGERCV